MSYPIAPTQLRTLALAVACCLTVGALAQHAGFHRPGHEPRRVGLPVAYTMEVGTGMHAATLSLGLQKRFGRRVALVLAGTLSRQDRSLDVSGEAPAEALLASRSSDVVWYGRYRARSVVSLGLGTTVYPIRHGHGPFVGVRAEGTSFVAEGFAECFDIVGFDGERPMLNDRAYIAAVRQQRHWMPGVSGSVGYAFQPSSNLPLSLEPALTFRHYWAPSARIDSPDVPGEVRPASQPVADLIGTSGMAFSLRANFQLSTWR